MTPFNKSVRAVFHTLANQVRIDILQALSLGEKNVTTLAAELNLGQTHVSHNLRKLVETGFVQVRKDGQFRYYSLNKEFTDPILAAASPAWTHSAPPVAELSEVLNRMPLSIAVTDKNGIYTFVGGDAIKRLNMDENYFLGKSIYDTYKGNSEVVQHINRALHGENVQWKLTVLGHVYDVSSVPYRDDTGEILGVVTITRDTARTELTDKIYHLMQPCSCGSDTESWRCHGGADAATIMDEECPCGSARLIRACCMRP